MEIIPAFKNGDKLICIDDSSNIKIKKHSTLTVHSAWLHSESSHDKDGYVRFNGRNTSSYKMTRFITISDLRKLKIKEIEKYEKIFV
jgi:hypothetical protein